MNELSTLLAYSRFIFSLCLECKNSYTVFYIDFTLLFALTRHLKTELVFHYQTLHAKMLLYISCLMHVYICLTFSVTVVLLGIILLIAYLIIKLVQSTCSLSLSPYYMIFHTQSLKIYYHCVCSIDSIREMMNLF